jgi:hypothetical protein
MPFVLILGALAVVALVVVLLQRRPTRRPTRRPHRETYFSHTLGVSDPAPARAEDETPAR